MHTYLYIIPLLLMVCCTPSEKKKNPADNAYGDYEIADPSTPSSKAKIHTIEIKQMKFEPSTINVQQGDEIIWINKDIVDHDVTEQTTQTWTSSKLPVGASWSMIAKKSALYYCSIHVVMEGKIIVDGAEISMLDKTVEITMCKSY